MSSKPPKGSVHAASLRGAIGRIEKLEAVLDRIEERLEEGVAPGKPWGNEHMALQIVREERERAL